MSATWDPSKHSKNKLGLALHAIIVPDVPIGAQVSLTSGILHIKLPGGVYLGVYKPVACLHPDEWKPAVEIMPTLPDEPSYSGSGSEYKSLHVELGVGVAEGQYVGIGPAAYIRCGVAGPLLARVYVDPLCPVASTDEDPITGVKLPTGIAKLGSSTIPGISIPEDPTPDANEDVDLPHDGGPTGGPDNGD